MYTIIGADFVPTESNVELFKNQDIKSLVGDGLLNILKEADYRIFNLEVPLTDTEKPIIKQGPNLIAPTASIKAYKALDTDLLTLANNHIMDQDEQGLVSTITTLDAAGISHLGAGSNLKNASTPFIFSFASKKMGVYACAEHEFSIAADDKPGANPFDPLWSFDHVSDLKKETDFVIVLYHGGKEHYPYPSPNLQKVCRRFIDKGADLVICQHSHCIGCEEKYEDRTIVYGQGNFLFDHSGEECWKTSILVKIEKDFSISYIPIVKKENVVRLANEFESKEIINGFYSRSKEILVSSFVDNQYNQFAQTFVEKYLFALSGKKQLLLRIINKVTNGALFSKILKRGYGESEKIRIINYIDCEAHRELLIRGLQLKDKYKNENQKSDY